MPTSRRQFLRSSLGAMAVAAPFHALLESTAHGAVRRTSPGYGPLAPVKDDVTGLELLRLPEGFRYTSYGWAGETMSDGRPTPSAHDGMAVVRERDGIATLIRNHEVNGSGEPIGGAPLTYDPRAKGGCTQLDFDTKQGTFTDSRVAISGTVRNCAGGPTPWGTWLTCEETVVGPDTEMYGETKYDLERTHGWILEVAPDGKTDPVALEDMGRFVHEAIAVDPESGIVYETEDRGTSGLYRFTPHEKGRLAAGGKLQMLSIPGVADTRKKFEQGRKVDVTWVDIEDPKRPHHDGRKADELGVYEQGKRAGGATFARLEGCWYAEGVVYFSATSGGNAGMGQIWALTPKDQTLTLVYESPRKEVLDYPDNITVSPRGGLLLCEDGSSKVHRLHGLTLAGEIFTLAENNIEIPKGGVSGVKPGAYRDQEWCGATFTADGRWLFANVQSPGVTFAITGPWENGAL
jgi:uncharacterized protein